MALSFGDIFARNIIHVCFGEDISDDRIDLMVREGVTYVNKNMSIKEAIFVIIDQVCITFYTNVQSPINWLFPYTGKVFKVSSESKMVEENCRVARTWIKDYIAKRRAGTRKSTVQANTDILTLMMERPDVFTDDVITDELLGFFGAASETTQSATKTIVTYLTKNRESLHKVRAEFSKMLEQ